MINQLFKFKIFFWFLLTISSLSVTEASWIEPTKETTLDCFFQPLFAVKTGYFFFTDSKMRKVYDRGGFDIQLAASYPLRNITDKWTLNAYGAIEYFHRSGRSLNEHQKTSLWSVPINIGLKPVYTLNAMQYYFTIGPRYFYIHQHNNSSYVDKNKSGNGLGFFVNTGFNYLLCHHFVVDIFGEYSYANMRFHSRKSRVYTRNIQMGGLTFGGGLWYRF